MKSFDDPTPNEMVFYQRRYEKIAKELLRDLGCRENVDFKFRTAVGESSGINLAIFSFNNSDDAYAFEELFHSHCDWS